MLYANIDRNTEGASFPQGQRIDIRIANILYISLFNYRVRILYESAKSRFPAMSSRIFGQVGLLIIALRILCNPPCQFL
ncbi:hypothetical protein Barb6_02504 [Bacteroidales bacterium Barb6]|nr:hypothetical protein Barb6_02504 [Bacteroidales bacterium Barb6]